MSKFHDRISLLTTFVRIAESGSLSAAGRDLNLSQPSVSRQLKELETQLGAQLFRRNTHSLALTEAGSDLLADARQIIASWESLHEKFQESEQALSGKLKVVAPVALGQLALCKLMCQFQIQHPNLSIA